MKTLTFTVLALAGASAACAQSSWSSGSATSGQSTTVAVFGPKPDFGGPVTLAETPPPISGGTLAIAADGMTAIATDPDRDRIYVVDLPRRRLLHSVNLPPHSEPGRVAVGDDGRAYAVLRRSGGLAVVDQETGASSIREVCSTPRGVAFDPVKRQVVVACASGEIVAITADQRLREVSRTEVGGDLRDVIVRGAELHATRFRSAELLRVRSDGTEVEDLSLEQPVNVAWRAIAAPVTPEACDRCTPPIAMVVQEPPSRSTPVPTGAGGYASGGGGSDNTCSATSIVSTRLFVESVGTAIVPGAVLPVDLASNGREYVIVAAGNAFTKELPQLFTIIGNSLRDHGGTGRCITEVTHGNVPGQAIAAAFDGDDELIVQTREPAALHIMADDRRTVWKSIVLSEESRNDTGHAIFHANAGGFLACASCHPEGGEDGRVWTFENEGDRRTPSLHGTLEGTAPYHWNGEMQDLRALVDHVLAERMSGPELDDPQLGALQHWLFALPAPPPRRAPSAPSARGGEVFAARCQSCHSGPRFTNNLALDVGTGGKFQVPSLVGIAWRPPFLHNGCAQTLGERFTVCGTEEHGQFGIKESEITDLVAYLETL